ncbi:MAG: fibronectin type III domain-containing protein [Acidimicrobiales bacterium]
MTVIAGVLIGTGFPGGVASASEVFGPSAEIAPLAGLTYVDVSGVSCTSSGNCTVVGEDGNASFQGSFGITETDGSWGTMQQLVPPSDAQPDPAYADLGAVSCASPGNCVAVGNYGENGVGQRPVEATETNGTWEQMAGLLQLPNGADSYDALMLGVSCPSVGNCVATGEYGTGGGSDLAAMVEVETNGSWAQATQIESPSNASPQYANGQGIWCTATTANCTIVGFYEDTSQHGQALADTETNGSWAQAVEISLPSDADPAGSASLQGISCPVAGNCEAVGTYENSSGDSVPMAAAETSGTWMPATGISLPNGAVVGGMMVFNQLQTISCTSIGNCVAGGAYSTSTGGSPAFFVNETAGVWAQGTPLSPPSNADTGGYSNVNGVSCTQDGTCELAGTYYTNSDADEVFVDSGMGAPSVPVGVAASAGVGSADVSWTPSSNTTSYSVYSSTTPGGENYSAPAACTSTAPNVECTVSGLTNGTTYYFTVVAMNTDGESTPSDEVQAEPQVASIYGYSTVGSDGGTFSFGNATYCGSEAGDHLAEPMVGIASSATGDGYWEIGADGGVFGFGDVTYYGSMAGKYLSAPIVGIAALPSGNGYWEVGSDGGIFAFGQAKYYGSEAGQHPSAPIVAMAATPTGDGYWEVASNGAVYSFGDAIYYGGEDGHRLSAPIVGMTATPSGDGYWLVGSDGGVFSFGDAAYYGSEAGKRLAKPMVGIAPSPTGDGYWEVAADGGIFSFGDAKFEGSMGGGALHAPVVGIASLSSHVA